MRDALPPPRYGTASLAEVGPALLAALGAGGDDPFGLGTAPRAVLVLVDGLGWPLLEDHADDAAFLAGHTAAVVDAAFPTTTVASLASLALGVPPGQHGLVGVTVALPGEDRPLNLLRWKLHGHGEKVDLVDRIPPERYQPRGTLLERAARAGLSPVVVGHPDHDGSGLTRALWRGGRFVGAGDLPTTLRAALAELAGSRFVYGYHGELDRRGHNDGLASQAWRDELVHIDRRLAALADRLPAETLLVVTGDHGMVELGEEERLDVVDVPDLLDGVRVLAGEARVRHVHVVPGARDDVAASWADHLDGRARVVTREEAVDAGWFGPVRDEHRDRIGDVVAVATGPVGIVQSDVDPLQARMVGHHGALTDAERLVPLVVVRT